MMRKPVDQVKIEKKQLYKEYGQSLDRVTALDVLLEEENEQAQRCLNTIDVYSTYLKSLEAMS